MNIKLLIASPDSITRFAFDTLFAEQDDFSILDCVDSVDDALLISEQKQPHILLLCGHFLARHGSELISRIKKTAKKTKLVVFNSSFTDEQELFLVQEGVLGIFDSKVSPESLVAALRKIHSGECWLKRNLVSSLIRDGYLSPEGPRVLNNNNNDTGLTERENNVLSLIAAGYKNREISSKLCISGLTVKTHINHIFKKLGVKDRRDAVRYAIKLQS